MSWLAVVVFMCAVATRSVAADLVDGVDLHFPGETKEAYVVHLGAEQLSKPLIEVEQELLLDENTAVVMTAHDGKRYFCKLPGEGVDEDGDADEDDAESNASNTSPEKPQSLPSLLRKLDAHVNHCYYRVEGWWTYELCHGKQIRQYHAEGMGPSAMVTGEFSLGEFDIDATEAANKMKADAMKGDEDTANDASIPKEVTHVFTGGTPCDLTSLERETTVVYKCLSGGENTQPVTQIQQIAEPATCRYLVTVVTPELCDHQSGQGATQVVQKHINCRPIDLGGVESETAKDESESSVSAGKEEL